MAWLGFFYILKTLDHAIYHVWFHPLPTTLDRRGRKSSEYCNSTMPMAGIEPGPPAQQVRALSTTPLPPGRSTDLPTA